MIKIGSWSDLLRFLDVNIGYMSNSDITYVKNELNNFLQNEGFDIVTDASIEPSKVFSIELNRISMQIGVTSIEVNNGNCKYVYWLDIPVTASLPICNNASLNIYTIKFDIEDKILVGLNNSKPRLYKLYTNTVGTYFRYGTGKKYVNEFMYC